MTRCILSFPNDIIELLDRCDNTNTHSPFTSSANYTQFMNQLNMVTIKDILPEPWVNYSKPNANLWKPSFFQTSVSIHDILKSLSCLEVIQGRIESGNDDKETTAKISTCNICKSFDISVFILPPHTCLPLHDHPDMIVWTKVLYGELFMESYDVDKEKEECIQNGNTIVELLQKNNCKKTTQDSCWLATPNHGNIHQFSSRDSPCVFIDVILPPYDEDRICSFYEILKTDCLVNKTKFVRTSFPSSPLPVGINYPNHFIT